MKLFLLKVGGKDISDILAKVGHWKQQSLVRRLLLYKKKKRSVFEVHTFLAKYQLYLLRSSHQTNG